MGYSGAAVVRIAPLLTLLLADPAGGPIGDARVAEVARLEAVSVAGGAEALRAAADFLQAHAGDKEMERHGRSALRRLSIDTTALVAILRDDPTAHRRAWAAWTAGEHELAACAEALLKALKDPEPSVRARAIGALAILGDARAEAPLLKLVVHDPDATTRERASEALVALAAPRTAKGSPDASIRKLGSSDVFARLEAVKELERLKDARAVGPLLELLGEERDLELRKGAISALASIRDEIAVPRLIEIARADVVDVRRFAIGALATLDDGRAQEPLLALTRDPDGSIRKFTLRALAFLARPGTLAALTAALGDPVPEVRSEAAQGLARLGDRAAADPIARRIGVEGDASLKSFLLATLGNLGTIGDGAHEKAMVEALEDDAPLVRTAAAAALAKIGTRATEKALVRAAARERKRKQGRDPEFERIAEHAAKQVQARGVAP